MIVTKEEYQVISELWFVSQCDFILDWMESTLDFQGRHVNGNDAREPDSVKVIELRASLYLYLYTFIHLCSPLDVA